MDIENEILRDIRTQNFKINVEKNLLQPSEILKYRITRNGNMISFQNIPYAKFTFFLPFDQEVDEKKKENEIKIYDANNLQLDIHQCDIMISNKKRYDFRHFVINIDLLQKELLKNRNYQPPPIQLNVSKTSPYKKRVKIIDEEEEGEHFENNNSDQNNSDQNNTKKKNPNHFKKKNKKTIESLSNYTTQATVENDIQRINEIETKEDKTQLSLEEMIWYLRQRSNNRQINPQDSADFKNRLQTYEKNYLYENVMVNPQNYSTIAVGLVLSFAPFFYTYPRFYNASGTVLIVGLVGFLMCMNYIQNKYSAILQNNLLSSIFAATTALFYFFFFVFFNKISHLSLFFMSGGIIFLLMNYIIRIHLSNPSKEFAQVRMQFQENRTFTPYNQRIGAICDEITRRYELQIPGELLYSYIASYEIMEMEKGYLRTDFVMNILQPILSVVILYIFGRLLNNAKNYTLLKSQEELLEESMMMRNATTAEAKASLKALFEKPEDEFHPTPLIGFSSLSQSLIGNQYNYFLPKSLNIHYIMEEIIDEVRDKVLKPKSAHIYQKTLFEEKIVKKLDKDVRHLLQFIQNEYLPVCQMNDDGKTMRIRTTRKDNRYNLYDGTYNRIHDLFYRKKMVRLNLEELLNLYLSHPLFAGESEKSRKAITEKLREKYEEIYFEWGGLGGSDETINSELYEGIAEVKMGKVEFGKRKTEERRIRGEMAQLTGEIQRLSEEIAIYEREREKTVPLEERLREKEAANGQLIRYQEMLTRIEREIDGVVGAFRPVLTEIGGEVAKIWDRVNVSLDEHLFMTLIQYIEDNNQTVSLEERNDAIDNMKYKFKDIYDFITNEELFQENETKTMINIIEARVRKIFETIYSNKVEYQRNNILLGDWMPDVVKRGANQLFQYLLQPISMWVLLGKIIGSGWWSSKMVMSRFYNGYEDIMRSEEYDGHFSAIWRICSMGIDRFSYEEVMSRNRKRLVEKMGAMDWKQRALYYLYSGILFIFMIGILNAYNNMIYGMSMYPLWTNLPGVLLMLIVLVVIYFLSK